MKNVLIGFLAFTSVSSFANCIVNIDKSMQIDFNPKRFIYQTKAKSYSEVNFKDGSNAAVFVKIATPLSYYPLEIVKLEVSVQYVDLNGITTSKSKTVSCIQEGVADVPTMLNRRCGNKALRIASKMLPDAGDVCHLPLI